MDPKNDRRKKRGKRGKEIKTHLDMAAGGSFQGRWRVQIELFRGLVYSRSNGGEGFNILLKTLRAKFLEHSELRRRRVCNFHLIRRPERENKEEASPASYSAGEEKEPTFRAGKTSQG